jgi:hypothetical protein
MMYPDTEVRFAGAPPPAQGAAMMFKRQLATWDSMAEYFGHMGNVRQPLWPLSTDAAEIEAILRRELPIPSCAFVQIRE